MTLGPDDVTRLLHGWHAGDAAARTELVELVYRRVRAIAGSAVRDVGGATMTPTEVAHEALLRLLGGDARFDDRKHFFGVVAKATRQVLIDAARKRLRIKRGGGETPLTLSAADESALVADENLIRIGESLDRLAAAEPRQAEVIELTYFGGLDRETVAGTLGVSVATIDRDLRFGRAWLKVALGDH